MNLSDTQNYERLTQCLVDMAIESWRFARLFERLIGRLDAGESSRYLNQYRYYLKRLSEILDSAGMRLVEVMGQPYDPGMAVTALNLEDFGPNDDLIVEQMIEPIIMGTDGLIRSGVVILRKAEL